MAKYHHNVYPIPVDNFSYCLDLLKDFYKDIDNRFPYFVGDATNLKALKFILSSLPENVTFMVLNSDKFSVWVLPSAFATVGIEKLINVAAIDFERLSRDVGYYELRDVLDDLPYNYHYIIQRYYE